LGALHTFSIYGLPVAFPWLANPLLWVGLRCLWTGNIAAARSCGLIATALAAAFLLLPLGELGHLGIGYWTWLASMVLLLLGSFVSDN
jgi:hypothetical protein